MIKAGALEHIDHDGEQHSLCCRDQGEDGPYRVLIDEMSDDQLLESGHGEDESRPDADQGQGSRHILKTEFEDFRQRVGRSLEDDPTQCGGEEDYGEYPDKDTAIDGNGRAFVGGALCWV